jgi:secreted PhoX family phosphatase
MSETKIDTTSEINNESSVWSRRNFLKFMGASSALTSVSGCSSLLKKETVAPVVGIDLSSGTDDVILAEGLEYKVLIKEGDKIGSKIRFGTNNDYLNLYTFADGRTALWANHESLSPILLHGRNKFFKMTKALLRNERKQVGGSFVEVEKQNDGSWKALKNSNLNFRLSGLSKVPLSRPIDGTTTALGSLANCSGGYTPWGTILTCEENYDHFYGEVDFAGGSRKIISNDNFNLGWEEIDPRPPEHYGWVVEVSPKTKSFEKLISLGRFAHECATVAVAKDGTPVVYSGDDSNDECLYKFISSEKDSLKNGTLYVADLKKRKWLPLDVDQDFRLKAAFKNQTELLVRTREAARIVGGTPLARPEDIEVDPISGDVFVTLTNNKPKGNFHGEILKISERNKKSLSFRHKTFKAGGLENGFSCPDNMAFDTNGNLWLTSDISGGSIGKEPYKNFGHNGLFVIPRRGPQAGEVIKVASAPVDAELTGPFFSPDQKTLFLSVQHPGEKTKELGKYTSLWPRKNKKLKPLSAVITISGPLLDKITS